MSRRIKGRKIVVEFKRAKPEIEPYISPHRLHGGCGVHTTPEPYNGPKARVVRPLTVQREFIITRVERSPTGSAHGSFRVEEKVIERGNERLVIRGYHCSWPDAETCLQIARDDELHRRIGYRPGMSHRSLATSTRG